MSFEREVFPVLENASGQGAALSQSQAGDAAAGKKGLTAFAFKDSANNLVLPTLSADGKVPVTMDAGGVCLQAFAKNATGSLTEVPLATIPLVAGESYSQIAMVVSSTRTSVFRLVQVNDSVETELAVVIVGAGQFTADFYQPCLEIAAGLTGTQELKVFGINLDKASQLSATISCLQKA